MSNQTSPSDKLSLSKKKLELKKSSDGSNSNIGSSTRSGRNKTVQVEVKSVKKKRTDPIAQKVGSSNAARPPVKKPARPAPTRETTNTNQVGRRNVLRALTDEEKAHRLKALELSKIREEQAQILMKEEQQRKERADEEEKIRLAEEKEREAIEEQARAQEALSRPPVAPQEEATAPEAPAPNLEASQQSPETRTPTKAKTKPQETEKPATPHSFKKQKETTTASESNDPQSARLGRRTTTPQTQEKLRTTGRPTNSNRRASNRVSLDDEFGQKTRTRSMASVRRKQQKEKRLAQNVYQEKEKVIRYVTVPELITVQELSNRMAERGADVIKALMKMGVIATINQTIDADTTELIIEEFGHKINRVSDADVEDILVTADDKESDLVARAPVVTIMGHVDHGKTSLLDAIRKTNVIKTESGGITQHIGAYQVQQGTKDAITFLDTPGHAAFTNMRARGAKVTDIVILVVAANDGIMPQTVEAINHAKAANVPIIVAINKIDLPAADVERVRTDLLQHGILVEAMSGEVQDVEISALTGHGLDTLLEAIQLQAEVLELKSNPTANSEAVIIEAKLDKGRGPMATVLIKRGTLKIGDIFVVGNTWGRVRALINDQGKQITSAAPSYPAEILGLQESPEAGDSLIVVESESKAREIIEYRSRKLKDKLAYRGVVTLDQMFAKTKANMTQELPIVIKTDVQGSAEAIAVALEKIGNSEVKVRNLHSGVGGITESDITLAAASNALIIGFNVRANSQARELAKHKGIEIRYYSIIYDIINDIRDALSGMLSPEIHESTLGYATVQKVFNVSKLGTIAGCVVTEGVAVRNMGIRQLRDNIVIYQGKIKNLKRFKDDVKEVQKGYECGITFDRQQDIRVDDIIEVFELKETKRKIEET